MLPKLNLQCVSVFDRLLCVAQVELAVFVFDRLPCLAQAELAVFVYVS